METQIISGIRIVVLTAFIGLFILTFFQYMVAKDKEKAIVAFWLLVIGLNLWLIFMAAKTSSLF